MPNPSRPSPVRRRGLLGLLAAGTTLALLAGCGAGADVAGPAGGTGGADGCDVDAPAAATTVNVLAYTAPGIDPFTDAMTACTKDNLTVKHGPVDFSGQLTKANLSLPGQNPSYDIVEVYTSTLNQYAANGWITPLDDFAAELGDRYDLDDISPTLTKAFTYDGKLYALPMQVNVHEMVYRKDIFDKLGLKPPTTFAELTTVLKALKDSGIDRPMAMPLSASTYVSSGYFNSLKSLGGRFNAEGSKTATLDTPEARTAMESLKSLVPYLPKDVVNSDESTTATALQRGDAAIGISYSGSMGQLLDPKSGQYAEQFAFAPPPAVEEGGLPWATVFVDGFALAANSKADQKLLFQVAAVGTGAEATKAAGTLVYPARTSVLEDPELADAPGAGYWKAVTETLEKGADRTPARAVLRRPRGRDPAGDRVGRVRTEEHRRGAGRRPAGRHRVPGQA